MLILICLISVMALASCSDEEEADAVTACNHTFGDWVVSKQATCTEAGYKERYCYFCDSVIGVPVEPLNHDWADATCMAPKTCSICFATEGTLGAHVEEKIPMVQQSCIAEGLTEGAKCKACDVILVAQEVIPAHFRKELPMVPSTCSQEGKTAGEKCYVCQTVLVPQLPISCHEPVPFPGVAATCMTTGLSKGTSCSICKEPVSGQSVIEFIDHIYDENNYCTMCNNKKPSEGLVYVPAEGGAYYGVAGIGTCTDTDIVIAPTYNGKLVLYVASNAFKGNSSIKSVTIPNTVFTISNNAFSNCASLESITMCDSVTSIKAGAFTYNPSLTSIKISSKIKDVNSDMFIGSESVIEIENGVYYIDNWAIGLVPVIKGENKDSEDDEAPVVIVIRDGTVGIAADAFAGCEAVEIVIPESVLYIGNGAFADCKLLSKITLPSALTSIGNRLFANCEALEEISIPASVTAIGEKAFLNCALLESIVIPEKVSSIGSKAFFGCDKLTSVSFENTTGWYAQHSDGDKPMWANIVEDLAEKLTFDYSSCVWVRK